MIVQKQLQVFFKSSHLGSRFQKLIIANLYLRCLVCQQKVNNLRFVRKKGDSTCQCQSRCWILYQICAKQIWIGLWKTFYTPKFQRFSSNFWFKIIWSKEGRTTFITLDLETERIPRNENFLIKICFAQLQDQLEVSWKWMGEKKVF